MTETEADTRANRIDPVLREAGWGVVEGSKIRREMICPGRITGGGRVNPLSADYVLSYRDRKHSESSGALVALPTGVAPNSRPRVPTPHDGWAA